MTTIVDIADLLDEAKKVLLELTARMREQSVALMQQGDPVTALQLTDQVVFLIGSTTTAFLQELQAVDDLQWEIEEAIAYF